ncbi:MAG: type II toxin-antitoxin system VapC family toxin [Candidatus Peregrinibacteria bacterium]
MENKRIFIDSNIFVAFYLEEDALHEKAIFLLEELKEREIIIPYCVIQEVSSILCYRAGKKTADVFLKDIDLSSYCRVIDSIVDEEILFFQGISQKISFTDASLLFLSKKYNAELFTFDKQLLNISRNF